MASHIRFLILIAGGKQLEIILMRVVNKSSYQLAHQLYEQTANVHLVQLAVIGEASSTR
jgi:hypothetical protein